MEDNTVYMLSTTDNPYSPFTQFDEWKAFDESKGYFTCEYLARITNTSSELPDDIADKAVDDAINDICRLNVLGIYRRVKESDFK